MQLSTSFTYRSCSDPGQIGPLPGMGLVLHPIFTQEISAVDLMTVSLAHKGIYWFHVHKFKPTWYNYIFYLFIRSDAGCGCLRGLIKVNKKYGLNYCTFKTFCFLWHNIICWQCFILPLQTVVDSCSAHFWNIWNVPHLHTHKWLTEIK